MNYRAECKPAARKMRARCGHVAGTYTRIVLTFFRRSMMTLIATFYGAIFRWIWMGPSLACSLDDFERWLPHGFLKTTLSSCQVTVEQPRPTYRTSYFRVETSISPHVLKLGWWELVPGIALTFLKRMSVNIFFLSLKRVRRAAMKIVGQRVAQNDANSTSRRARRRGGWIYHFEDD